MRIRIQETQNYGMFYESIKNDMTILQTLKMASLALWPFGKTVRSGERSAGCLYILMNVLWIFLGGIWICLSHLAFGVVLCITIIGIPFGLQHFKLAGLALTPFGKDIISD